MICLTIMNDACPASELLWEILREYSLFESYHFLWRNRPVSFESARVFCSFSLLNFMPEGCLCPKGAKKTNQKKGHPSPCPATGGIPGVYTRLASTSRNGRELRKLLPLAGLDRSRSVPSISSVPGGRTSRNNKKAGAVPLFVRIRL
jgi:hypothetical protein